MEIQDNGRISVARENLRINSYSRTAVTRGKRQRKSGVMGEYLQ